MRYDSAKQLIVGMFAALRPAALRFLRRHKTIVKYGISGGTAVAVNLAVLYVCTDVLGIWYVVSAAVAFSVSLVTGFYLQKFWTFRDTGTHRIKRQMALYTSVGLLNLALGPLLLFLLVEALAIWYLAGQVMVMAVLALESYFINRFVTFKQVPHEGIDAFN
ncbi:MAG: GtrA family protein [Patescibacteria group bacterium]|nr:GtrA family protein [Patescibacteria group bacterium]